MRSSIKRKRIIIVSTAVVLLSGVSPAFADACLNFWFSRNLIAERSGHCFGSALGRDLFSNENCNADGARISPADAALMKQIALAEKNWNCAIDTNVTGQRTPEMPFLRRLDHLPLRDDTESSCIGFKEPDLELRSAPRDKARIVGTARQGQHINDEYLPSNGWSFALVYDRDNLVEMGWYKADLWNSRCENYAG